MKRIPFLFFPIAIFFFSSCRVSAQSAPSNIQPSTPAVLTSAYGEKLKINGVPNPGKINGGLYRGAQPSAQGFEELKKLGITTVVDLRGEDRGKDWEKNQVERLGMHYIPIPIGNFAAPTNEEVMVFLSLVRNADANQKVFVHCHYGEDRTGVFIAAYRMGIEKWPAEQAMHEMYAFGFNGMFHPAMKAFVRDFPARMNTAPALAALKDPKSPVPLPAVPPQPATASGSKCSAANC
jgi:tyrosine-protein phosphatase SIW14